MAAMMMKTIQCSALATQPYSQASFLAAIRVLPLKLSSNPYGEKFITARDALLEPRAAEG